MFLFILLRSPDCNTKIRPPRPSPYQAQYSDQAPKRSPNRSRSQRTPDQSSFQSSDQNPNRPSNPMTDRVPRRQNQDDANQTEPVSVTVSRLNSQSLSQSPDRDHERTPDIPIEETVARSISRSRELKKLPSYRAPYLQNKWISQRIRETTPIKYPSRSPNRDPV